MPKTIKEFYLELADGTINYEYNDDTGRKFNLDNLILTDVNERQVHDRIQFLTDLPDPSHSEGLIFYDQNDHCLAYYNEDSNVKVSLSREQMVRVYNNNAFAISDGLACYINGATGGWPTIGLTIASSKLQTESTIGICTGRMEAYDYGYICISGNVNGIDTSAYPPGTILYISGTAGALTSVPALQPNYNVEVATVLVQNATVGSLLVRVDKKNWFPSLQLVHLTNTVLPTVPTVFKPSITQYNDGFIYSSVTGEIEFTQSASYSMSMQINALPSASNKSMYFYLEKNTGAGWVPDRYSARLHELINNYAEQVVFTDSEYFAVGTKIRLVIWGMATVTLLSTDLPGTTAGTVTLPAFRLNIA